MTGLAGEGVGALPGLHPHAADGRPSATGRPTLGEAPKHRGVARRRGGAAAGRRWHGPGRPRRSGSSPRCTSRPVLHPQRRRARLGPRSARPRRPAPAPNPTSPTSPPSDQLVSARSRRLATHHAETSQGRPAWGTLTSQVSIAPRRSPVCGGIARVGGTDEQRRAGPRRRACTRTRRCGSPCTSSVTSPPSSTRSTRPVSGQADQIAPSASRQMPSGTAPCSLRPLAPVRERAVGRRRRTR